MFVTSLLNIAKKEGRKKEGRKERREREKSKVITFIKLLFMI